MVSLGTNAPPVPFDPYPGCPVYSLGDNRYAIDDSSVAAAKMALSQMRMMSDEGEPILPGDGGDSTNYDGGGFSPMDLSYETNGSLWIQVASVDTNDNQITLLLHSTTNNLFYQLLSKTNLLQSDWNLGEYKAGDNGTNATPFRSISMTSPQMFFRAQQASMYLYIAAWQDAYASDPALGDTNRQKGIFYIIHTDAPNDTPVSYSVSGTARNGIDYSNISGVVTVPAGSGYGEVDVQPTDDDIVTNPIETVTLTLLQGPGYVIDPGAYSATVNLYKYSAAVKISAASYDAVEPDGPPGAPAQTNSFDISRSDRRGHYDNPMLVHYEVSGTASNGVDYQLLSGSVTIAANASDTNLNIVPIEDNLIEGMETVTVTILPGDGYAVDTNNPSATISIADSSTTVSISWPTDATEPGGTNAGVTGSFTVSRGDSRVGNSFDLPVQYSISGTAENGVDYSNLSGTVTIPAGQSQAIVEVQPLADELWEDDETVTLTLFTTNGDYLMGDNASATLLIHDYQPPISFTIVVTNLPSEPVGIDYDPVLTNVIVSIEDGDSDFHHDDFIRLGTNGAGALTLTNWSGIQGLVDEVKVAIVKTNLNGFVKGDMFFGSNTNIGWLSVDGTRSNLNWCILTNEVVTNSQWLRGSLCVDQTGVFSNDLVAVTSDSSYNLDNKGVWLVNSNGQPRLLANILTKHLEGVITLPNDTDKYGPWAGKILTGDEAENMLYTIDTNGVVTTNDTENLISGGIGSEDFDIIPTNQDLYCTDESHSQIVKILGALLTPYVGDLLITQSGDSPQGATPTLFIVRWDSSTTNFVIRGIPHDGGFEHVTFAPIDLPASP